MENALKTMIQQADDDYLTGLCNKGTVKRAYKDLAQESPSVTWQAETAEVALSEETCVIRVPLGESTCSCPSRSMCRHIITAILWLKQQAPDEHADDALDIKPAAEQENTEKQEKLKTPEELPHTPKLLEEILKIPTDRLKRACRGKRYQQFLAYLRAGELPAIEESSIVTVMLPWEKATVKLLEPFTYSTCTCHSRELCAHKAQAVLAYQLSKGQITLKELDVLQEEENTWDMEQVQKFGKSVCDLVIHQMSTGLSRQSPEISESLERQAVIAHRTGLPAMETLLREASSEYKDYFSRSAAFRSEELFRLLMKLYSRAGRLQKAEEQKEIQSLAGTFRDTYEPVGKLHLLGMGGRTFKSKTGYEGEIYYFLEPEQKRWYTWTDARPVFYDGVRRRPPSGSDNAMAPWGLNCSREQLQSLEFELLGGKAAAGGRLSVSRESKGEILGERSLLAEEVRELIYWDYEELLQDSYGAADQEQVTQNRVSGRRERLFLAGAVGWGEAEFDTIQQRFSWSLYDRKGKKLFISLKYTKEEKMTINLLERLERRLQKHSREAIVFFGSVYLDESGRLCLYPIEFFLKEADEIAGSLKETKVSERADEKGNNPELTVVRMMEQYRRESVVQLSDLLVSGLCSVQEDIIRRLEMLADDGERLGLHTAGEEFACISHYLDKKRHQMEFTPEPVIQAAGKLEQYFRTCQEKLAFDTALLSMREPE